MGRIKLENIKRQPKEHQHKLPNGSEFCPTCGESVAEDTIVTEYACAKCRFLVKAEWDFCPLCGEPLIEITATEHYDSRGEKLSDVEFAKRKSQLMK